MGSFFSIAESHGIKLKPEPVLSHTGVQQSFQPSSRLQVSQSEGLSLKSSTVASETIPAKVTVTTSKIWDRQIEELEKFFKVIDLPAEPIKINNYCTIIDVSLFIESHFSIVKAQNGNKTYEPYLDRLFELKSLLSRN